MNAQVFRLAAGTAVLLASCSEQPPVPPALKLSPDAVRIPLGPEITPQRRRNDRQAIAREQNLPITVRRVPGGLLFWRSREEGLQQARWQRHCQYNVCAILVGGPAKALAGPLAPTLSLQCMLRWIDIVATASPSGARRGKLWSPALTRWRISPSPRPVPPAS